MSTSFHPVEDTEKPRVVFAPRSRSLRSEELRRIECLDDAPPGDPLVDAIRIDLAGADSALELMRRYLRELAGTTHNDSPPLLKLRKLFELGRIPAAPLGHHYGITLGLRTGDLSGALAEHGNVLGWLWGAAIGPTCPWVGKSFFTMDPNEARRLTGDHLGGSVPIYRGINHFNRIAYAPVNLAGNLLLGALWQLEDAPAGEQQRYGHEKNGGHFLAHRARSVHAGSPRQVLQINYRYPSLHNPLPLQYLIDELVDLGGGLYLGQLLFATASLTDPYDPAAPDERYHYQHFGYFLLFGEPWNGEARRLFPHLEMPTAATASAAIPSAKLTTLTLESAPAVDPTVLAAIRRDLQDAGSVLRLIQGYSDELLRSLDTRSPALDKLQALFGAGIAPERMNGFYAGALVTWLGQGLLGSFDKNSLNLGWRALRTFSPWTGKRFDPIDAARLGALTEGHETDAASTQLCANTVAFRSPGEKLTRFLMQQLNVWMEEATAEEERLHGYHARTFFFIGRPAPSIGPANKGKRVYQFNYRWPKLKNPPPDFLCIDELMQIADGLYLGQVYYATNLHEPWNPATDPARYDYRLYEYFLLMDAEWQAHRLEIGFDLEDV